MAQYDESIDIKSDSLESQGGAKRRIIKNNTPAEKGESKDTPSSKRPYQSSQKSNILSIRTFQSDLAEATQSDDASLANAYVKQQKQSAQKTSEPTPRPQQPRQRKKPPQRATREPVPQKPKTPKEPPTRSSAPLQPKRTSSFGAPHHKDISVIKRRSKSRAAKQPKEGRSFNVIVVVISFLFFAGASYMVLPFMGISVPTPSFPSFSFFGSTGNGGTGTDSPQADPLIESASVTNTINLDSASRREIIREIDTARQSNSQASEPATILFSLEVTDQPTEQTQAQTRRASAQELFSALDLSADPILPRTTETYTFGFLPSGESFFVARVRSIDRALGALYAWESDMYRDFQSILELESVSEPLFKDREIGGIDSRVLVNTRISGDGSSGAQMGGLTYAISDNNFLVITSSVSALERLFEMLE